MKLQPRFSGRYMIDDKWSLKCSYAEMQQNLHLLTNSSVGLPTDIWVLLLIQFHPNNLDSLLCQLILIYLMEV